MCQSFVSATLRELLSISGREAVSFLRPIHHSLSDGWGTSTAVSSSLRCFHHAWCRPPWTWLVCPNYPPNRSSPFSPAQHTSSQDVAGQFLTTTLCCRNIRNLSAEAVDHKTPSLTSEEPSVMEPQICDQTRPQLIRLLKATPWKKFSPVFFSFFSLTSNSWIN